MSGTFRDYFWLSVLLSNLNQQQMYRTALQNKGLLGAQQSYCHTLLNTQKATVQRFKTYVQ